MMQIMKRNLLLYFRDRGSIFFSLLAVMITFLLYIFVFRNLYGMNIFGSEFPDDMRNIVDVWAIGGIVAAPTVTTPLGSLWVLVNDRNEKRFQDFYTSPVQCSKITAGYTLSSYLIGVIMTCILLAVTQVYLLINGGSMLSALQLIKTLGVILISTFSGSGLVLLLVSLFSSNNAFTGISLVMGTLMGFITGNYMPIGILPEFAQQIIRFSPAANASDLLRQIIVKERINNLLGELTPELTSIFNEEFGIVFRYGDYIAPAWLSVAVLVGTGVMFYALAIPMMNRKKS